MTSDRSLTALRVLDFWRCIEALQPYAPPVPQSGRAPQSARPLARGAAPQVRDVQGNGDLPWAAAHEGQYRSTSSRRWSFQIYLGITDMEGVVQELIEFLNVPDDEERNRPGEAALLCLCVDHNGVVFGEPALSTVPWALCEIYKNRMHLGDFREFEKETLRRVNDYLIDHGLTQEKGAEGGTGGLAPAADVERAAKQLNQLGLRDCENILDILHGRAQWKPRAGYTSVARWAAVKQERRDSRPFPDVEPALVNSFFLEDIDRVAQSVRTTSLSSTLESYLFGTSAPRRDVRNPAVTAQILTPEQAPLGRWPSRGDAPLVFAQQLAINGCREQLAAPGIFSVNGPPGTGKTTLLRDLVAAVVVDRAKVLARFGDPLDAFGSRLSVRAERGVLWRVAPELLGFEMVVASSNNGAVENVTRELPALSAVDEKWLDRWDYFREVADNVSFDPDSDAGRQGSPDAGRQGSPDAGRQASWALMSAVLGNAKNRGLFVHRFWFQKREPHQPPPMTFKELLSRPPEEWAPDFQTVRERFSCLVKELEGRLAAAPPVTTERGPLTEALQRDADDYMRARERGELLNRRLQEAKAERKRLSSLPTAQRAGLAPPYLTQLSTVIQESVEIEREMLDVRRTIAKLSVVLPAHVIEDLHAGKPLDLSLLEEADRQLSTPWTDPQVQQLRALCFLEALELHKAFIAATRDRFRQNIAAWIDLVSGKAGPLAFGDDCSSLWATFFMAVPVVSTTFASFSKLFTGIHEQSLGWLFIDEAGQAKPQAALGAVWRARRTVAIGDPFQLEPVLTLPLKAVEALRTRIKLDDQWHPVKDSVQILADRANPLGTEVASQDQQLWVGAPLRVHRRCREPMFSIANEIAYDGLMVQGRADESDLPLRQSCWFDVPALNPQGHYSAVQGDAVCTVIQEIQQAYAGTLEAAPGCFIISPFTSVVRSMKERLYATRLMPYDEIAERVGTIHTFQGKEAPVVILLLGGNPSRPRARAWAAEKPNLLNVAVTRARDRLYVIGDRGLWGQERYFDVLAGRLPVDRL